MSSLRIPKRLSSFQSESHRRAPKQEKEIAKRIGGRQVSGSGSGFEKGDVRVKGAFRVEAKTTKHGSFSVTEAMFDKIDKAASGAGEVPVIVVELCGGEKELAVMPVWALEMFCGKLT